MSAGAVVPGGRAVAIQARLALVRLLRSKTPWIAAALALCPVVFGLILSAHA